MNQQDLPSGAELHRQLAFAFALAEDTYPMVSAVAKADVELPIPADILLDLLSTILLTVPKLTALGVLDVGVLDVGVMETCLANIPGSGAAQQRFATLQELVTRMDFQSVEA